MKNILRDLIRVYPFFLSYKKKSENFNQVLHEKALVIKVSNPDKYRRYFYCLLKYFSLAGYSIFFPDYNFTYFIRKVFRKNEQSWNYYNLIFEEGLLIFSLPYKRFTKTIELNDKNLSPDYFGSQLVKSKGFYIPMSMHSIYYHSNNWNTEMQLASERKKSIFMTGNFSSHYSQFEVTPFNIESRIQVYDFLKQKNALKFISSEIELQNFVNSEEDHACIISSINDFIIQLTKLRQTLASFRFYLALPGVFIPFSHNLIEALSVGTIPILHTEYAKWMKPNLKHMKNAILYENLEDLILKIDMAYRLQDEVLEGLKENVLHYYRSNLTPQAVVGKIEENAYDVLYLQAEKLSAELFKKAL